MFTSPATSKMFTPPAISWPSSGFIDVEGPSNNGAVISQKTIVNASGGKAVRIHRVDDWLVEDIEARNMPRRGVQVIVSNGGLIRNVHFDAELNETKGKTTNGVGLSFGQRQADGTHLKAINISVLDTLVENVRQGSRQSYPQGDGGLVERGSEVKVQNHESRNHVDSHWDVKSKFWLRNALLIGGPMQRKSIRAHSGAVIYLMYVTFDGQIGTAIEISGGNPDWPDSQPGKDAIVYYYRCIFGSTGDVVRFKRTKDGAMPVAETSFIELTEDPFPNGLPLYEPGGVILPPPSPPPTEPPMSSLKAGYVFFAKQSETKTLAESGEYGYGTREGHSNFNDMFFYKTLDPGTYGPSGNWDNVFGDPNRGYAKEIYVKEAVVEPPSGGLTEDRVIELVRGELSKAKIVPGA